METTRTQTRQTSPAAYTLSQLANAVGYALNAANYLKGVWITAELSDLSVKGGHCYAILIEKSPEGRDLAKMRTNVWAAKWTEISARFMQATGRRLATGMKVMIRGNVEYHPVFGLSFNVTDINPTYTLGDIERIRREILERLAAEGILDANKRLRFPDAPLRVAVISSKEAAGYGDFVNQIENNPYRFSIHTKLFPAFLQGERTVPSVTAAMEVIRAEAGRWDCLVIIRGGGATSDMTAFDSLPLARAVALFPLPVVVGIGHERDRCVLDEIANVRCKTPTAVAAFLIDTLLKAWTAAMGRAQMIADYAASRLQGERHRLSNLASGIPVAVNMATSAEKTRLADITASLPLLARHVVVTADAALSRFGEQLRQVTADAFRQEDVSLSRLAEQLRSAAASPLREATLRLENAGNLLKVLDPAATLRRGYSITRVDGHAVTDASEIPPGTSMVTQLASGSVVSVSKNETSE